MSGSPDMVERVARALFLADHPGSEWSAGRARVKWFFLAEAAIEAMREPTEEVQAVLERVPGGFGLGAWFEGIDAALGKPL